MNFRLKPQKDAINVDITPLIDVVFLLLIFFMVSTTFKAESKLIVELPKADNQAETAVEPQIALTLDRDGLIEYRGNIIGLEELGEVLETVTQGDKERPILVRADQKVAHGIVVSVIDKARQQGFNRISVATRLNQGVPAK